MMGFGGLRLFISCNVRNFEPGIRYFPDCLKYYLELIQVWSKIKPTN